MVIVEISVVTKSPKFSVSLKDGKIRIRLTSPPEKGEANAELVKELSRALGGANVRILSGHTSRRKKLEIGMDEGSWKAALAKLVSG
jgi:uncharacterized protein (TIGR00251 family)